MLNKAIKIEPRHVISNNMAVWQVYTQACLCRLVWAFAGRVYHIVGDLMPWLKYTCSLWDTRSVVPVVGWVEFLFDLILYVPVSTFSIMSGWVFLSLINTKKGLMCLSQGNNALPPVRLEPAPLDFESSTLPLSIAIPIFFRIIDKSGRSQVWFSLE